MKKAVVRETAVQKRKRVAKTAATQSTGKRPEPKIPRTKTFDPDAFLNAMEGMVFVASADLRLEYMNETALRNLGRDMTGRTCHKALHGLDERCPWCMAGLVLQGQTIRQEVPGQRDGRWYSSIMTPVHREDGSVAIQSLVFDITDQKLAEAALSQREALLKSILQAAPAGIGMVRDRVIEWTNEQVSHITGYAPAELKGKSARIFYASEEEFDRVGRHKYAEIRIKGTGSIVTVWRRKDGKAVNIFLSSTPINPCDLSAGVVFTALDITEKKKAQGQLWRSEEKYRALFENAVMGIFQSTPDGRFLSVNPATAKMCGYDSPEEMVASITDIASQHYVDPAEREPFIRAMEEQGVIRNFEHRTYRRDGSVFWVSVNARAVRDKQGRITHYEGTHEDIQGRKEAEEALKASEERFSKAFHSSPAPMTIATIDDGRFLDVNDRFVEMHGYSREELLGKTSAELGIWPDPSVRQALIRQLREEGSVRNALVVRKAKDGTDRHTLWSAETIRLGDRDVLLTLQWDITEQKEAQERLRLSEEKYRNLFENSLVGVFQSTLEGRYITVNPAFARMHGYDSPEDVVRSVSSIAREIFVDAEDRRRGLAILYETGILEGFEARTRRRDGRVIWTVINSRIVRDAAGQPLLIEGLIEDITQRKRAEEALNLNGQRLEALQTLNQMSRATVQELCDFALEQGVRLTGSAIGYLAFLSRDESAMTMFSWSREAMERCSVRNLTDVYPVEKTGLWGEAVRQRRPVITNDYAAPNALKRGIPNGHVPLLRHMNVPVLDGERIVAVVGVGNKETEYDESDVLQLTLLAQGMWRIIQRRRADEALRAGEERFFKVFQANPIPMTIGTIEEGRILDVNDRAVELSGYSREELIGRTSVEIGLWAYPEERDRLIAQLREDGLLRDGLAHFRTRNGKVAPALWSADRIRLEDKEVILTTIHDISKQVEAQEKLRQSEEKYRLLAENVTDIIWTADLNLAFTYVSPSSERVFGWSPFEWTSRPLHDFLTPASLETVKRLLREETGESGAALNGEPRVITTELELYRKNGTTGWYEVSAQFIRDDDGRPMSIIGVARDIAERKNAEKQSALLEQQLRQAQKMEAVGTMAGGIAHDFNNILFAVIGYAELCLQDETDEDRRWNLTQILSACGRAKSLVNQILAFSRQIEQERQPLDIVPLAKEAIKFLRSSLPSTIDVRLEAATGAGTVLANPTQIHQVLMNLCTNAAHAMRLSGGRLQIAIDNSAPPPEILAGLDASPGPEAFVRLSVSDTGHGIEPSCLNRIFDPFFTTKAPGEGTGLGLSVIYGIVKDLGGAIRVDSISGRGSTFDVYFPSVGAPRRYPACAPEAIRRGTERILFVDDEDHLVEVMGQVLSALGYRVTTVRESRRALEMIRIDPGQFDLVITDMTMPDMTGADLAREILRLRPDTPIILCTGYSELISEEEALKMGIRRFLMKPLFMGDVAKEIRSVLEEPAGRPAARSES